MLKDVSASRFRDFWKRGKTMWGARLRDKLLRIRMNDDFREFVRGVVMAFGWLIVSTILVTIAAFIVSAVF
jgi:hypothetical protein